MANNYELSLQLKQIAMTVDLMIQEASGERIPFSLVVYSEGQAQYVGSCKREEALPAFRKFLDHWESNTPDIPLHTKN